MTLQVEEFPKEPPCVKDLNFTSFIKEVIYSLGIITNFLLRTCSRVFTTSKGDVMTAAKMPPIAPAIKCCRCRVNAIAVVPGRVQVLSSIANLSIGVFMIVGADRADTGVEITVIFVTSNKVCATLKGIYIKCVRHSSAWTWMRQLTYRREHD